MPSRSAQSVFFGPALMLFLFIGRHCFAADFGSLNGMDGAQIESEFGKPDDVVPGSVGNERWHYGDSVLFLNDGKVVAWSDRGDLAERRRLAGLQRGPKKDTLGKDSGWVNTWTPEDKADVDEILDDLMR